MVDPDEPIQDIAHLGHVELLTPKPTRVSGSLEPTP